MHGEYIGLRMVNLWTDEEICSDTIEKSIDIINGN